MFGPPEIGDLLRDTRWDGGQHWGTIIFDKSGRTAKYVLPDGETKGEIYVQGGIGGYSSPLIGLGEWHESSGKQGAILIGGRCNESSHCENLEIKWGPGLTAEVALFRLDVV